MTKIRRRIVAPLNIFSFLWRYYSNTLGERKVGQITISAQSGRGAPIGLLWEYYRALFLNAWVDSCTLKGVLESVGERRVSGRGCSFGLILPGDM